MDFPLHVPPSAIAQLVKYFRTFSGGSAHMSSLVAAELLIRSGLYRPRITELWKRGGAVDCNFDEDWFIETMFSVTAFRNLRAQVGENVVWVSKSPPGSYCDICQKKDRIGDISYVCELQDYWACCSHCSTTDQAARHKLRPWRIKLIYPRYAPHGIVICNKCSQILQTGDCVYHCQVCNDGDFDLCPACYSNSAKRCGHNLKLGLIVLSWGVIWLAGMSSVTCDSCDCPCNPGSRLWCCKVCNDGNFYLCETCYAIPNNRCGHTLFRRRIRILKDKGIDKQANYGAPSDIVSSDAFNRDDRSSEKSEDLQLRDSLTSSILTEKPQVKWGDVAGLGPAKNELREVVTLPTLQPQLFNGKRQPKRAILLYGPPGTGKTYLAKAVATEVDHTLFSISSSDLMSKWIGESEGLVRRLFELARQKKPSIIFIDEIDALCGNRDGGKGANEHTARMKTEFLVQVDGVGKDNSGVLLLAATNRPWELDPAMRRRFQKRIHIPLPDQEARKQLFRTHGGDSAHSFTDLELSELARHTKGLSGSDIANASQEAMMLPIRRATSAKFFRQVRFNGAYFFTPCDSGAAWARRMNWEDVPSGQLLDPKVELTDFLQAIEDFKPSVAPEEIQRHHEWTTQVWL